jgi:hypothetical protein
MSNKIARKAVFNKTNGRCAYCGEALDPFTFHREHAIPRSRGGPHRSKNIVPSCNICNSRKRTKTVVEFRDYIRDYPLDLLENMRKHLTKYATFLPNKNLVKEIDDAIHELYVTIEQLRARFYLDELDIDLFLDGDLESHNG